MCKKTIHWIGAFSNSVFNHYEVSALKSHQKYDIKHYFSLFLSWTLNPLLFKYNAFILYLHVPTQAVMAFLLYLHSVFCLSLIFSTAINDANFLIFQQFQVTIKSWNCSSAQPSFKFQSMVLSYINISILPVDSMYGTLLFPECLDSENPSHNYILAAIWILTWTPDMGQNRWIRDLVENYTN